MPLSLPDDLLIGIPELDDQHRTFYAEVNRLHEAMREHRLDHANEMAAYLEGYVSQHFSAEERLMIDAGYPGYREHVARHDEFRRDYRRWRTRLAAQGATASMVVELSSWMTNWLRDHIRRVDSEMARFLRSRKPWT